MIEEPVEKYLAMEYGQTSDIFWAARTYIAYNVAGMYLSTSL